MSAVEEVVGTQGLGSVAKSAGLDAAQLLARIGPGGGALEILAGRTPVVPCQVSTEGEGFAARPDIGIALEANPRVEPSGRGLTVAAAAILATLVAAAVAFLLEARRRVVRTAGEIHAASGVFAIGRIESFGRGARRHRLPTAHDPQSRASEGYRAARTGLIHALHLQYGSPPGATMLVTSPAEGDGKSTTVCNLAVAFGLAGHRVLCIDADLRNPKLHEILGLPSEGGLSALLLEDAPALGEMVHESPYPNVSLLPAGSPPRNPSELLSGSAMLSILDQARNAYDLVILDSPPALAVTDAAVVGGLDTPILLVVRAGRTKLDALQEAVMKLRGAGATTLGAVLNGASRGGQLYESSDVRPVSSVDGSASVD